MSVRAVFCGGWVSVCGAWVCGRWVSVRAVFVVGGCLCVGRGFMWGVGVCVWGVGLCGVGGGRNEEGRGASRCGATLCALKCIVLNSYMCVCLFVYVGVVWFVCPRCARQPVAHTISFCAPGYRELIEVQWIQLYKS